MALNLRNCNFFPRWREITANLAAVRVPLSAFLWGYLSSELAHSLCTQTMASALRCSPLVASECKCIRFESVRSSLRNKQHANYVQLERARPSESYLEYENKIGITGFAGYPSTELCRFLSHGCAWERLHWREISILLIELENMNTFLAFCGKYIMWERIPCLATRSTAFPGIPCRHLKCIFLGYILKRSPGEQIPVRLTPEPQNGCNFAATAILRVATKAKGSG